MGCATLRCLAPGRLSFGVAQVNQNSRSSGGLVLLTFSALTKRIWMGFLSGGDFVLGRAAELGLLLLGGAVSFLLTPLLSPLTPFPLRTMHRKDTGEKEATFCAAL